MNVGQRTEPERSRKYRLFVDLRPCCVCGLVGRSTHHHHGPKGQGQTLGDLDCVPLCKSDPRIGREGCHDRYHAGRLSWDERQRLESAKLMTLMDYALIMHGQTAHLAPLASLMDLREWLQREHPEDFDDPGRRRPVKKSKIPSRPFAAPRRRRMKMGERAPERTRR